MNFYSDILDDTGRASDSEKEYSVVTGTVKENYDKDHPGMVRVEYFLGEKGKNVTGWIPVAMPYAGKGYGSYVLPEVQDTVVIAFDRGDRNCPIVIGSLWGKVNTLPPDAAQEKNNIKSFTTKGGCVVTFDDTDSKNIVKIETSKKLNILLEDESEKISVSDEKGDNSLVIDSKNGTMTLSAAKKLEIKVNGNVMASFEGSSKAINLDGNKIDINASQALNAKGSNTQISGSTMTVKGDSTAKVESSGMLQVKGSMVKIN